MKTLKITNRGSGAHYGFPDKHVTIRFPSDWEIYRAGTLFALCPPGIQPPAWTSSGNGIGLNPQTWSRVTYPECALHVCAPDAQIIIPNKVGSFSPPLQKDVQEGFYCWGDAMGLFSPEAGDDNINYTKKVYGGLKISTSEDPITGPLAPLRGEQQNALAESLYRH